MSKWFVYIEQPYYPSGWTVEAATPEAAVALAWKISGEGPGYSEDRIAFAVCPHDQVIFSGDHPETLEALRNVTTTDVYGEAIDR